MATVTATCATLLSLIRAAVPGDTIVLPLQPQPCGYMRIHNVVKAEPGVTIRIDPRQQIGPHITNSAGLNFIGGHFAGADSRVPADPNRAHAGAYVRFAERISFRNATFGAANYQTATGVIFHDSTDFEVLDSRIAFRRIDGMVITNSHRFRIINNDIPAGPETEHHRCRFPDGSVTNPWTSGSAACEAEGGTYLVSSHPDGLQMYHSISDGLIARNRATGSQQGLGFMGGPGALGHHRVAFIDNVVHINYYRNGIAMGSVAENILVRGNRMSRMLPSPTGGATHIVVPRGPTRVACENEMGPGTAATPWGSDFTVRCPTVLPTPPQPPRGLPLLPQANHLPGRMPR